MKNKPTLQKILILFLNFIIIFQSSCKTAISSQLTGIPLSLKIICNDPKQYLNKEIDLEGIFSGWSGGNCNFIENYAHQLTRSDWIFCDSELNCIYVTGGKPDFLDPLKEEDLGENIRLKAKLMQDVSKKYYLKFISAYKSVGNN